MNKKIGNVATYIAGILLFIMGVIYFLKNSFMPHHSDAIMLNWEEVDTNMKFLVMALMRTIAGGFFTAAFTIIFLQRKFSFQKLTWIPILILISGILISLPVLYGILTIKLNTPGNPPIYLLVLEILFLVIGYIFNQKSLKN